MCLQRRAQGQASWWLGLNPRLRHLMRARLRRWRRRRPRGMLTPMAVMVWWTQRPLMVSDLGATNALPSMTGNTCTRSCFGMHRRTAGTASEAPRCCWRRKRLAWWGGRTSLRVGAWPVGFGASCAPVWRGGAACLVALRRRQRGWRGRRTRSRWKGRTCTLVRRTWTLWRGCHGHLRACRMRFCLAEACRWTGLWERAGAAARSESSAVRLTRASRCRFWRRRMCAMWPLCWLSATAGQWGRWARGEWSGAAVC
mmetsp:Transcript_6942/g.21984  ORF Transcript_6942/g.21984 Transcript_6942/m.21984 type:complete len:255 (+) Transcript_6942:1231-1995(+)